MRRQLISALAGLVLLAAAAMAQSAAPAFRWPEGKHTAVSFSFDDARPTQVDAGVPIFDKYGLKATFYLSPRSIGRRLEAWKKASAEGHEMGNHSNSHPCTLNYPFSARNALEDYTLEKMGRDLDTGSAEIERLVGVKPVTFAYPCGLKFVGRGEGVQSYVPLIAKRYLAGRGFRDEGTNDPAHCDFAQLMGTEGDGLTFEQMKALVSSSKGRWVAFACHDVGAPGRQVTQAEALDQFLKYAKDPANGIWVDTIAAVAKYVKAQRGGN